MDPNRDQIEEIKSRLDVVDVVGRYVQLKQAGKNFSGLCPFHSEKTPSFIVSPELQRYKCFGCGASGDIFNFVQNLENIDFPETLEKLAKEAGVELKKRVENSRYTRVEEINKRAAIFFYKALKDTSNSSALKYVKERGITEESIKTFGIGFAPRGMELLNFIQKDKKYSKEELINSGLFVEKEGKIRGKFFMRVMFPIRSSSGKVIAFTGRVLPGNEFGPKYMNSPETPIYHKKENLYGQYESRQEIRKNNLVIMCEGTTDVISAHQIGIKNIVAPLGTAITKEQIEKISKLTKDILFLFDSDSAGQQALERGFLIAQELGLSTFAATTAPYKDIDDLIIKDPKRFKTLIEKRLDTFTYLLTEFVKNKNLSKLDDYKKTVIWIQNMIKNEKSPTILNFYVESVYKICKIKLDGKKGSLANNFTQISKNVVTKRSPSRELAYLQYLLYLSDIQIPKDHDLKYFENPDIKEVLEYIKKRENVTRSMLIKHFENSTVKKLIENSIFSFAENESTSKELEDIYRNLVKDYFTRKEIDFNVKISIAEAKGDLKESEKLLKEYQNLSKEKTKNEQNSRL
ncbi:MAG: DNA primase [Candidatus Dojkabacteria bacterium]|jgi:DNA primase|nr:DNA primase [Candidatus Dojkabacteria bacterium]